MSWLVGELVSWLVSILPPGHLNRVQRVLGLLQIIKYKKGVKHLDAHMIKSLGFEKILNNPELADKVFRMTSR